MIGSFCAQLPHTFPHPIPFDGALEEFAFGQRICDLSSHENFVHHISPRFITVQIRVQAETHA